MTLPISYGGNGTWKCKVGITDDVKTKSEQTDIRNEENPNCKPKKADFVLIEENPLENLKVLYGTGAIRINDENEPVRIGGIDFTIKDGIVYDAKKLLRDVENMVNKAKIKDGELKKY